MSVDGSGGFPPPAEKFLVKGRLMEIRNVWTENLEEELANIRRLTDKYTYVAMDTEFPGVVAKPLGNHADYHYQTLRCNVDLLKIIQLGITFADENGELALDCPTWQFNFRFNLQEDMYAQDSIELLQRSGIDFELHAAHGIDVNVFGELFMSSGLVLNEDVTWVSFHSGYDFGYLLKLLTAARLPAEEGGFFDVLRTYFPKVYDIKQLMSACDALKGGLNKLAEDLEVDRVGPMHQAGSDSLLTSATFFKLRKVYFEDGHAIGNDGKPVLDVGVYLGELYGLGGGPAGQSSAAGAAAATVTASVSTT